MSKDALVKAVWQGPFDAELPDGGTLTAGSTYEVHESVLASGHWRKSTAKDADNPKKETD